MSYLTFADKSAQSMDQLQVRLNFQLEILLFLHLKNQPGSFQRTGCVVVGTITLGTDVIASVEHLILIVIFNPPFTFVEAM